MAERRHSLVLTGGGARCAYQAGALLGIAEITGARTLPFPILAGTSGGSINAALSEQPAGDCSFRTSGGSITLALNDKIAADVDLHTSAGQVSTDVPVVSVVKGEHDRSTLRGKVNGGGPLITAHTSGGNVRLEKK